MNTKTSSLIAGRHRALLCSIFAFTACFAAWTIFSIIGIKIKSDLSLNDTQFGILIATPILTGSLSRLILGIWSDQFGGRIVFTLVMIASAVATYLLTYASTYPIFLLAALGVGLAGGSFAVGTAYVSKWYPQEQQGTALGFFGMGNVGSALTSMVAPTLLVVLGWQSVAQIYAAFLLVVAAMFMLLTEDDPALKRRRISGQKPPTVLAQLAPLKKLQVWRFSLYYFFVFGAFVALALWLPRYYMGVYGLDIRTAGLLTACYALPGSLFRALGGWLSDKWGARKVMYVTFIGSVICAFILSYPATDYIVRGIEGDIHFSMKTGLPTFVILTFMLGVLMSFGKAAVFKHIPVYYPNHVGSVGGIVGLIGGLGGFFLPISFGIMNDLIGVWTSCFMLLFLITSIALIWMHVVVVAMEKRKYPALGEPAYFPELDNVKKS